MMGWDKKNEWKIYHAWAHFLCFINNKNHSQEHDSNNEIDNLQVGSTEGQ